MPVTKKSGRPIGLMAKGKKPVRVTKRTKGVTAEYLTQVGNFATRYEGIKELLNKANDVVAKKTILMGGLGKGHKLTRIQAEKVMKSGWEVEELRDNLSGLTKRYLENEEEISSRRAGNKPVKWIGTETWKIVEKNKGILKELDEAEAALREKLPKVK